MPFKGFDALDSRRGSQDGAWLTLKDPRDNSSPLVIDGEELRVLVAGPDSTVYSRYVAQQGKRLAALDAAGGDDGPDAEKVRQALAETAAPLALDWQGFREDDGTPSPCRTERVIELFAGWPWARVQVENFAGTRRNFLPKRAGTS